MSELRPPTRWLDDDASAPRAFAEAARCFREDEPTVRMRQHMWHALEQSIAARVVPRAWRMPWRGMSALLLVGTGVMLGVRGPQLHTRVSPAPVDPDSAAQVAPAVSEPVRAEPLAEVAKMAGPAAVGGVSPRAAPVGHRPLARAKPKPTVPPATVVQPPPADEVTMLVRARKLLQSQPERALALTTQHSEVFPQGVFAEERELLASEALRRLGRYEQLNQRIAKFLATYPSSAHRRRIEGLRGRE